jgi:hypothetical protein
MRTGHCSARARATLVLQRTLRLSPGTRLLWCEAGGPPSYFGRLLTTKLLHTGQLGGTAMSMALCMAKPLIQESARRSGLARFLVIPIRQRAKKSMKYVSQFHGDYLNASRSSFILNSLLSSVLQLSKRSPRVSLLNWSLVKSSRLLELFYAV